MYFPPRIVEAVAVVAAAACTIYISKVPLDDNRRGSGVLVGRNVKEVGSDAWTCRGHERCWVSGNGKARRADDSP